MADSNSDKKPTSQELLASACERVSFIAVVLARCIVRAQVIEGEASTPNDDSKLGSANSTAKLSLQSDAILGDAAYLGHDIDDLLEAPEEDLYTVIYRLCDCLVDALAEEVSGMSLRGKIKRESSQLGSGRYFEDLIIQLASQVKARTQLRTVSEDGLADAVKSPHLLAFYANVMRHSLDAKKSASLDSQFKLLITVLNGLPSHDPELVAKAADQAKNEAKSLHTPGTITPGGILKPNPIEDKPRRIR